jgi:hypothetical protein
MLYRATPPTWLTDAAIGGLCERLVNDYLECRFTGFQNVEMTQRRTRSNEDTHVNEETRQRVIKYVAEEGVDTIMLPLNFPNAYWCCVVVKAKRIFYYDSLNQKPCINRDGYHNPFQAERAERLRRDPAEQSDSVRCIQLRCVRVLDLYTPSHLGSAHGYELNVTHTTQV